MFSDAVTTLGQNVDGAVRRVETAYDTAGRPFRFASYDAASGGNIVNQVDYAFNGLGQLTADYQSHSGAVNTGTTPKVLYTYSEMASGANHSRLTRMTYPNGRTLDWNYSGNADGYLADRASRPRRLIDSFFGGEVEWYTYLGLDTVVQRDHSYGGQTSSYIKPTGAPDGDAGDKYTGLDRFGRVAEVRWSRGSTVWDHFQYGHDRNGNRLYRDNLLNNNFDELYHANGASAGYDQLNQLSEFRRGPLSDTNGDNIPDTVVTASRSQSWGFDALGNWDSVTTDGSTQTRSHNRQNEITAVSGQTNPNYDANGNLTVGPNGHKYVYDAWNRLVRVKDANDVTLVNYQYDALGRRITEGLSTTTDLYYSSSWQVLEERIAGVMRVQYVWSPVYVDALVVRQRDTNADGTVDESLWAQQDANWNVTSLSNVPGAVVERYVYDAFGKVTIYDANWNVRAQSNYAWAHLWQGLKHNRELELSFTHYRVVHVGLGRGLQPDPIQFAGGQVNFYAWVGNNVTNLTDPLGLAPGPYGTDLRLSNVPRPITQFDPRDPVRWSPDDKKQKFKVKGYIPKNRLELLKKMPRFGECPIEACKSLKDWMRVLLFSIGNRLIEQAGHIDLIRVRNPQGFDRLGRIGDLENHQERIESEVTLYLAFHAMYMNECNDRQKLDPNMQKLRVELFPIYEEVKRNYTLIIEQKETLQRQPVHPVTSDPSANVAMASGFGGVRALFAELIRLATSGPQHPQPVVPQGAPPVQPPAPFRRAG